MHPTRDVNCVHRNNRRPNHSNIYIFFFSMWFKEKYVSSSAQISKHRVKKKVCDSRINFNSIRNNIRVHTSWGSSSGNTSRTMTSSSSTSASSTSASERTSPPFSCKLGGAGGDAIGAIKQSGDQTFRPFLQRIMQSLVSRGLSAEADILDGARWLPSRG